MQRMYAMYATRAKRILTGINYGAFPARAASVLRTASTNAGSLRPIVAVRVTTTPPFGVQSRRVLFDASDFLQPGISRRNFDVAADDQRFLMVQRADGTRSGQVVVVENWPEEMRRRATQR